MKYWFVKYKYQRGDSLGYPTDRVVVWTAVPETAEAIGNKFFASEEEAETFSSTLRGGDYSSWVWEIAF